MKTTHNCQKNLWALVVQTETRKLSVSSSYLSAFQTSQENSVLYQDNSDSDHICNRETYCQTVSCVYCVYVLITSEYLYVSLVVLRTCG